MNIRDPFIRFCQGYSATSHVTNRGDRREAIFSDDVDGLGFIETLGEVCGKGDWQVPVYCLMPNLFHLVVEMPGASQNPARAR